MLNRLLGVIDLDTVFMNTPNPILLDRIDYSSKNFIEELSTRVFSKAGELNFVSSCNCGEIRGNYYEGLVCRQCNSVVRSDFSNTSAIHNEAWLGLPQGIKGVLHPVAYMVLGNWLKFSKDKTMNYIIAIMDPSIPLPPELESVVLGRGANYFYDNFDRLMEFFLYSFKKTVKKADVPMVKYFIQKYRHRIFVRYLPVLNNILHAITTDTSESSRKYADSSSRFILEAAINLSCLNFSQSRHRSEDSYNAIFADAYRSCIEYYRKIIDSRISPKPGIIRHHLLGARQHFTFRSVIIPIVGAHKAEDLYLPWSIGVNLLKLHIINKLTRKHGWLMKDAIEKQILSIERYDPLINEIMIEILRETKDGNGLHVTFNRNPSLRRGALQTLRVPHIKPNPQDKTINISVKVLSDPNADKN